MMTDEPGGSVRTRLSSGRRDIGYMTWCDGQSTLMVRDHKSASEVLNQPVDRNLQDLYSARLDRFLAWSLSGRVAWLTIDGRIHCLPFAGSAEVVAAPFKQGVTTDCIPPPRLVVPEEGRPGRVLRWPSADAYGRRIVFDGRWQLEGGQRRLARGSLLGASTLGHTTLAGRKLPRWHSAVRPSQQSDCIS